MDEYLTKPISATRLLAVVEKLASGSVAVDDPVRI
jgi:DNA-binding response OmpR family regulator